tara:strand:+ start:315 stop:464 length:150 start_codon:yes stop_codon:yes gene_type:complete
VVESSGLESLYPLKTFATKKEATSWIKAIEERSQQDTAITVLQPAFFIF